MKALWAILLMAATACASNSGGSGHTSHCAGFPPYPCSRSDTYQNFSSPGVPTNGPSTPFTSGPVNTPFIDPQFGNRVMMVTNGSTASNKSGQAWATPSAGWARDFNCAGTTLGGSCKSAPIMIHVEANGGGVAVFKFDRGTLHMTRVDNSSFTGPAPAGANLPGPIFDCCDPNRLFINLSGFEDNVSSAAAWSYYELTPASPAVPSSTLYLNMNAGPSGNSWDQQNGGSGNLSTFNGLLNFKNWPIPIAPIICDGTQCIEGMTPTVLTGSTCATVSGGTANAGCITVQTTGGSLSGTNTFAITQDDGGTPPSEQNIGGVTALACCASYPWTPYTFSGNAGEVTAVVAPTAVTSPVTAANWDFYIAPSGLQWETNAIVLAPRQFQVPSSTLSCSGAGGIGGCPTLPFTTAFTTVSAAHPTNYSCEQVTAATSSGKCELTHAQEDNLGNWVFEIGHGQGTQTEIVGFWNPTNGLRYINLATGVVVNGGTDGVGNACPSANCWTSTGAGAINYHPDPNTLLSAQTWGGLILHESAPTLSGTWMYLGNQIGPTSKDGPFWWNIQTGDVYGCSSVGTACSFAGHPAFGYNQFFQTSNNNVVGNASIDGNLDSRQMTLSGTNCGAGAQCRFSTTPSIQQTFSFSATGPCPASAPPTCAIPPPNLQTNGGYNLIGTGRADSHESATNENTSDTLPFGWIPYSTNGVNYSLSTTTNSTTRTGCPACVDTFITSGSTEQYFLGDLITVTGMADSSFNITGRITSTGPTSSGSKTFTLADPGKSNTMTQAQAGSGSACTGTSSLANGCSYKIDTTPGRAWENQVLFLAPAPTSTVPAAVYRIASAHFDILAGGAVTGPNVTVSPDGHFVSWTTTDGTGGVITNATLGSATGSGGTGYANGNTFTINNPVSGAVLATGHVVSAPGGVVSTLTLDTAGTLYTNMNNIQTTATSGGGSGLLLNITINSNQTAGGRTDVAFAEVK